MKDTKELLDFEIYPHLYRAKVSNCISIKTSYRKWKMRGEA